MRTDLSSQHGAEQIAARIKEYWRARGYAGIAASISRRNTGSRTADQRYVWEVRSNIGPNGYPPQEKK